MANRVIVLLAVFVVAATGCSDDAATAGPVTIETEIRFAEEGIAGTFVVTEGTDVLGCMSGSFADVDFVEVGDLVDVTKVLTCESGEREGSFSVVFTPDENAPGPGEQNGPWTVTEATGDFTGLQGGGDFSFVATSDTEGNETLTGTIEYGS